MSAGYGKVREGETQRRPRATGAKGPRAMDRSGARAPGHPVRCCDVRPLAPIICFTLVPTCSHVPPHLFSYVSIPSPTFSKFSILVQYYLLLFPKAGKSMKQYEKV